MAQKTLMYKGYQGTIEVNVSDYSLFGKILFLDENIQYKGQSFAELDENFRSEVDAHIERCKAKNQPVPFSE